MVLHNRYYLVLLQCKLTGIFVLLVIVSADMRLGMRLWSMQVVQMSLKCYTSSFATVSCNVDDVFGR